MDARLDLFTNPVLGKFIKHVNAAAGVATSAMVAATCYDAADRGYRVTVLRDGCADGDPTVHAFFMDKVFPGRAFEVVPCAGWPAGGGAPEGAP